MKSWKFALAAFLAGGLLGGWSIMMLTTQLPDTGPAVEEAGSRPEVDPHLVRDLQARVDSQSAEISRLKGVIRTLEEQQAPPPPPDEEVAGPPPEEDSPPPRRGYDRFLSRRVDELAGSLNLSDDQRNQLEAVFRAQFENMRARRHGEEVEPYNLDDALSSILTPEQFDAYIESSQEEIYNRAELMATTQVVRLNQMLELSPEQMDRVYETFNVSFQEMMISRQTGEDFSAEAMRNQLNTILTEEQQAKLQEEGAGMGGMGMGPGRMGP